MYSGDCRLFEGFAVAADVEAAFTVFGDGQADVLSLQPPQLPLNVGNVAPLLTSIED